MLKLPSTQALQQARRSMFQIILSTCIQGKYTRVFRGKRDQEMSPWTKQKAEASQLASASGHVVALLVPVCFLLHGWGSQQPTLASTCGSCPIRNFNPGSHREISNICIAMVSGSQWKPPWKTFLSPCLLLTECPVLSPVTEGQPSSPSAPQLASREALTLVRASYDVWHSGKVPWVLLWLW